MALNDEYFNISQLGPRTLISATDIIHIRDTGGIDSKMTIASLFSNIPTPVTLTESLTVSASGITSSSTSVNILKPTVIGGGAWDTINTLQVAGSAKITGALTTTGDIDALGTIHVSGSILQKINTSTISIAPGTVTNLGGNITLFGSEHSFYPNRIQFRNGSTARITIDPTIMTLSSTTLSLNSTTFSLESNTLYLNRFSGGQIAAVTSGGRFSIGAATDDGVNKLQVYGSAKITGALHATSYMYTSTYFLSVQSNNKSFDSINAVNASPLAWNAPGNVSQKLTNDNNAMAMWVSGTPNDRKAGIQVGHTSENYASVLGRLYLNPLGGEVYVGSGGLSVESSASITGGVNTDNVTVKNRLFTGVTDASGNAIVTVTGITSTKILSIRCYYFTGTGWSILTTGDVNEVNSIRSDGLIDCRGRTLSIEKPYRMYVTYEA